MRKKRTNRNINDKGISVIETIGFMASVTATLLALSGILVFGLFS